MGFLSRIKKQAAKAVDHVEDVVEDAVEDAIEAIPDPEELKAMAERAMRKILELATNEMIDLAKDASTWDLPDIKVPIPHQETFDKVIGGLNAIPFVGAPMANKFKENLEDVAKAFVEALVAVASSPDCIRLFLEPILELQPDDIVELCSGGLDGPALANFLVDSAGDAIKECMGPIVDAVLDGHAVTNLWQDAMDAYNDAADKLPGLDPIELDLPVYLLENFMDRSKKLLCCTEDKIKNDPSKTGDDDIMKLYGNAENV